MLLLTKSNIKLDIARGVLVFPVNNFFSGILACCMINATSFASMELELVNKYHQPLVVHFGKPLADGSISRFVLAGSEPADSTVVVGREWKNERVKVEWAILGDVDTVQFTADNQECVSTSNDKTDDGAVDQLNALDTQSGGMRLVLINKADKVLVVRFAKPLADGTSSRIVMAGAQETVLVDYKWKNVPVKISWEAPIDTDSVLFTQDEQKLTTTSDDKTNQGPKDVLE